MVADQHTFAERLNQIRARAARLRCEAFVDYTPVLCGMSLRPVTLASYNRLIAFESPFVNGGPVTEADVFVWVWVHHPEFGQTAVAAKRRVFAKVWRALHPRCQNLNAFVHLVSAFPGWRWLARFRRPTNVDLSTEVVASIRRLMAEALYGFPSSSNDKPEPPAADDDEEERKAKAKRQGTYEASASVALQAQILNTFSRTYRQSYADTEAMPLKKLGQLWREHLLVTVGDRSGLLLMDRDEAALWRAELEDIPRG